MLIRNFTVGVSAVVMMAAVAACDTEPATAPLPSFTRVANGSATLEWQEQARILVAANRLSPLATGRVLAALGVAQHNAVKGVDATNAEQDPAGGGYGAGGREQFEANRGAVAGASAQVLAFFFPAAATTLEQRVADMAEAGPGDAHPDYARGVAIGRVAGDAIVERTRNDGFTRPWVGPAPTGSGIWTPEALPPAGGTLGSVTPYYLTSGSQFRPAPPPAFGSAAFNAGLNEVITFTVNRTPAQLAIARLWDYAAGTPTPVGYWNGKAAELVQANDLGDLEATRVFALMHSAVFDALIGCWDAKYFYWTIRPYQASSSVSLALGRPNHPAYPSGHSCVSSSSGRVLVHFFPEHTSELNTLVEEAGMSRVYAGIHYVFDVTAGQQLGRAVADWVLAHAGQ